MDLNECMVHVKTQQEYYDLFDFLLNEDIITERIYNRWMSNNHYNTYKENTMIAIETGNLPRIQYCNFDYYQKTEPWKYWSYKTIEEILGPKEPFIRPISIEDIYKKKQSRILKQGTALRKTVHNLF